uniref:hypothetical protein n=1 Tax=Streptomyces anulatus TaxID=1892 RepID=UPI002F915D8D
MEAVATEHVEVRLAKREEAGDVLGRGVALAAGHAPQMLDGGARQRVPHHTER